MTGIIVLCLLIIAMAVNWRDKARMGAAGTVLGVGAVGYAIYYFAPYAAIVEALGYHQEQAIWLLASISILYHVKGRLAFCLMVLYLAQLAINATYFTYQSMGIDILPAFDGVMWLMFVIQMALLFSRRFTDVCTRGLLEFRVVRDFSGDLVNIRASDICSQISSHEGQT